MNLFSKLLARNKQKTEKKKRRPVGGMEDFMTLIRVYYQAWHA